MRRASEPNGSLLLSVPQHALTPLLSPLATLLITANKAVTFETFNFSNVLYTYYYVGISFIII